MGKYTKHYSTWENLYKNGVECGEIAKRFGCTPSAVHYFLKTRGIALHFPRQREYYSKWAELYVSGMSTVQIAEMYECSDVSISYGLMKLGIPLRDFSHAHRKYDIDETFFNVIDMEVKAYWLGFISADGNIATGRNRLVIGLSAKDTDHLVRFIDDIKFNKILYFYRGGYEGKRKMVSITIDNEMIVHALASLGIGPRKSLTLEFCDTVPPRYQNAYIRGYFDGDGSIYFDKSGKPYFALVGTFPFLKRVQDILIETLGLNSTKIRSKGKISELRYIGRNNVSKIRNWLYNGNGPWLQRKKYRFDCIG